MIKKIFLLSLILFNINSCYASVYYCKGNIIDTNVSAESFCKPPNHLHNKQMYQAYQMCLNIYNNDKAKIGMNDGYCKPATKRTYKGSCGEIVTEYFVSGEMVRSSSTGGNEACRMKQLQNFLQKEREKTERHINGTN